MLSNGPVTLGRTEQRTSPDNATEDLQDLRRDNNVEHVHNTYTVLCLHKGHTGLLPNTLPTYLFYLILIEDKTNSDGRNEHHRTASVTGLLICTSHPHPFKTLSTTFYIIPSKHGTLGQRRRQ